MLIAIHRTLEMIFRKNPRSNRQNPPRKSRTIHVLPMPLATNERNRATNHISNAIFKIMGVDIL